jgi:hypothetical protein
MIIESLALLLLQGLPAETVNVRIVSEPEAPAVLIGKPCEPDPHNRIVPLQVEQSAGGATDVLFGPVHSVAYECDVRCQVGLQVRDRRAPVSFRIGTIRLLSQGRWIQLAFPSIPIATSHSCANTPITVFPLPPLPNSPFPTEGFLLYLMEVRFVDGSKWQLSDPAEFAKTVTRRWQEEARRPNRGRGR